MGRSPPFSDKVWDRDAKIVIGIDIGTTQSAVSFAYLYNSGAQVLHRVISWPGQEGIGGEAKIPSIIFYDSTGKARSFGAEARTVEIVDQADQEQWELAEFFKLQLHPKAIGAAHDIEVKPLPRGVTTLQIYSDWMGYLFRHTEKYFQEIILDGEAVWLRHKSSIEFVFGHPNGWDIAQQSILRKAAVAAGLVDSSTADDTVHFVEEAEASVHFVMLYGDLEARLEPGTNFLVCDAGGSTVDTTAYTVDQTSPVLRLMGKRASACVQAGGIFVNQYAKTHLEKLFRTGSMNKEDQEDALAMGLESFEMGAKRAYNGAAEDKFIKVGTQKMSDKLLGIRRGSLTLNGAQIEKFFAPLVEQITSSVYQQMEGFSAKYLLVVGGFGESPYLRQKLKDGPGSIGSGMEVTLINESTAKAVADGAVIWFAKKSVVARATKFAFGTDVMRPYDPDNPEHRGRRIIKSAVGDRVDDAWGEIVAKDYVLSEDEEKILNVSFVLKDMDSPLSVATALIFTYDEVLPNPGWILTANDQLNPGFRLACVVKGDLSAAKGGIKIVFTPNGLAYILPFKIALKFGATEWKACLVWDEDGQECRGHASVIPAAFT